MNERRVAGTRVIRETRAQDIDSVEFSLPSYLLGSAAEGELPIFDVDGKMLLHFTLVDDGTNG
jgi:hypothetical protein